ncbi:MAG: ABC transporter ATP-binding protein [Gemmatimonadaceae bacterium]
MPNESSGRVALEVQSLRKSFDSTLALDDLTLSVPHGSIFGFLGPNGAGKTTTIRILTGLARASAGSVRVLGREQRPGARDVMREVGFLPDVPGFYDWMMAPEFLLFAGRLFGLGGQLLRTRIDDLLDLAGLTSVGTRIGGYSRGMKQRLGIAQALINSPKLLILDEPTSALDPIGRREVLQTVASLRGRATVFFSTHILADVERICDTVALLDRGRLVANGSVSELKQQTGVHRVTVTVDGDPRALATQLQGAPWLTTCEIRDSSMRLTVSDAQAAAREIPRAIVHGGFGLVRFEEEELSLEDAFVRLVRRDPA